MKNRFESSEVFTAYATIEAGYYMMGQLDKQIDKEKPRNGVEAMIDEATGYGAEKTEGYIKGAICILKDIIEAKKLVELDYSKDEEMLTKVKGLLR
jgi:hypothetical protein